MEIVIVFIICRSWWKISVFGLYREQCVHTVQASIGVPGYYYWGYNLYYKAKPSTHTGKEIRTISHFCHFSLLQVYQCLQEMFLMVLQELREV